MGGQPRFVSFEGPEGAGKSTQAQRLSERLVAAGQDVLLTREPGGTELGDRIRELVLEEHGLAISSRAETLLYCVARAQLVEQALRPALASGRMVIVDRYADSTLAYQGYGRRLELSSVQALLDFATAGLKPELTVLLDLPVDEGLRRKRVQSLGASFSSPARAVAQPADWNRYEAEELAFHGRVRQAYLQLAAAEPSRWRVIDARPPADAVAEEIWSVFSVLHS